MSEKSMSKSTTIKNYTVLFQYYKQLNKGNDLVETLVEEDIEIGMLARTSPAHTKFGVKCMMMAGTTDPDVIIDLQHRFVELMVVDDKIRKCILNDEMACMELFSHPSVQADIERFLASWGSVSKALASEQPNPSTNE